MSRGQLEFVENFVLLNQNNINMKTNLILIAISSLFISNAVAQNNSTMKTINNNAPVKCSKEISINANKEKVWNVITNINNWSTWQSDISNPKLKGDLVPNSHFDWKTGGAKIHSTIHTVNLYKEFGWTGKTFGMYAIHNWTINEVNGKIIVSVDESMEGFLAKLLKKGFNKNLEKDMQHWLELLKAECEK